MKKKIAVLFGGASSEYEVSLKSAYAVLKSMDVKYEIIPIGITKQGQWFKYNGSLEKLLDDTWYKNKNNLVSAIISPDRRLKGMIEFRENENIQVKLDAVFPILHGKNGEDGTVQGLIELAGIPLIGCGSLSSALSMDKDRAHRQVKTHGIEVPSGIVINKTHLANLKDMTAGLVYPLFIKPLKSGSSFGINKIKGNEDLESAVLEALKFDRDIIIEENIEGFEVGVGIIGNDELKAGSIDEIEIIEGFFDYKNKYSNGSAIIHSQARIDDKIKARIEDAAKTIYRALACKGFTRVDMFLTPEERIVFNEVNTIPGFTENSRFPGMMKAIDMSFEELVETIIQLGLRNE
nr:D-alanine--D-serine ligase VanG [Tissierella sp.]